MTIRRNYGNTNSPRDKLQRELDQEYEMLSLAYADGDMEDVKRRNEKIVHLQELLG